MMDRYGAINEHLMKQRERLTARLVFLALTELNNIGAEPKEAQDVLEFGKKVWEAERIALRALKREKNGCMRRLQIFW